MKNNAKFQYKNIPIRQKYSAYMHLFKKSRINNRSKNNVTIFYHFNKDFLMFLSVFTTKKQF